MHGVSLAVSMLACAAVVSIAAGGEVFEEVHEGVFEFPLAPGMASVPLPQFDEAGGTRMLLKASVSIDAMIRAQVTAENDSTLPAPDFALNLAGFMTVDVTSLGFVFGFTEAFTTDGTVGPSDGIAGSGPDFWDFGLVEIGATGMDMTETDLAPFIGTGDVSAEVFATGGFSISGAADATLVLMDFAAAGVVRVVYEYTALPGACCLPGGACVPDLSTTDCDEVGGIHQGDGTQCDDVACPNPPGACCLPDASCIVVEEGRCLAAGGSFQGGGGTCVGVICLGACCFFDGTCDFETQQRCQLFGGSFQGSGTTCVPNPCPPLVGACCFPDDTCTEGSIAACTAAGGIYSGHATSCTLTPCAAPTLGACCFPAGGCTQETMVNCGAAGGRYQGDDTLCGAVACPGPKGACCLDDGTCTPLRELDCAVVAGVWQGADTLCIDTDCPGGVDCPGDLDGSGDVGFTDLLAVLARWGVCVGCPEDLDGSGDVGFTDLLAVLATWGPCD
ncbi:MAG: choice-of-anchor E domain-containing protein [Phycisphaerales bacterium]|nr:choice-of-anchor E domain-containing protein [Phycisphaerae bacterium]NNF43630.1 choice-of-anchor E domain-containing protein [Phycisphaerales bacterium]NNM24720.1 choice-of-anchor E domain-containing protein [Phycisphaerales bacterium]